MHLTEDFESHVCRQKQDQEIKSKREKLWASYKRKFALLMGGEDFDDYVQINHDKVGSQTLKCKTCGFEFKRFYNMYQHCAIHFGEASCDICGLKFKNANRLQKHKKFKHSIGLHLFNPRQYNPSVCNIQILLINSCVYTIQKDFSF